MGVCSGAKPGGWAGVWDGAGGKTATVGDLGRGPKAGAGPVWGEWEGGCAGLVQAGKF